MATHFLIPAATTLLLLLSLSPTLTTGETNSDLVLDSDGNPLEVGSEYYIFQAVALGFYPQALMTFSLPGSMCPLYLSLTPLRDPSPATPVMFIPSNTTHKQIYESSAVEINSGFSAICRDKGVWRLQMNPTMRQFEVVAAGVPNYAYTWFKINRATVVYPSYYLSSAGLENAPLGFVTDKNGISRLGVSSFPLQVVFRKKTETQAYTAA